MNLESLPVAEFAFPGPLRDKLVAAIRSGAKTSTSSLAVEYGDRGPAGPTTAGPPPDDREPMPAVGDRSAVVDSAGRRVAAIEVTEVRVIRLADVDLAHAHDEGEGYTSVAEWRAGHERFWQSAEMRAYLGDPAFTVDDDTLVVAERFRLLDGR